MLRELIYHWTRSVPPAFSANKPSFGTFTYYPLKIIATQRINYVLVIVIGLREYEITTRLSSELNMELKKVSSNLRMLQVWRRRMMSTQAKLRRTTRYMQNHLEPKNEDWSALIEDYDFLDSEVTEHGAQLEATVSLVASAVSLIQNRRSLIEARPYSSFNLHPSKLHRCPVQHARKVWPWRRTIYAVLCSRSAYQINTRTVR